VIIVGIPAPTVTVGQKIKALYIPSITGCDIDARGQFTNQIVTVTRVENDEHLMYSDGVHRRGMRAYADFVNKSTGNNSCWYASEWEIVDDVPTPELDDKADPVVELTDDQKIIVGLRQELMVARETLTRVKREAIASMEFVNQMLNQEADDRDWCEQYDQAVDTVNAHVADWLQWEPRQREFTIRVMADIRVEDNVTVTATSLEDAMEMAQEMFDVEETFSSYGFDLRDIECEEA
jgi:hypothetical protein